MKKNLNYNFKNFQDVYYDGLIDERYEMFDEHQQCIIRSNVNYGLDKVKDNEEYIGFFEDYSDEYYIKLKNGEVKRIDSDCEE